MTRLFDPNGSKVFSIPAGANFLGEFARQLAEETALKENPEALADALIYVPNRRSERALAFALYQAAGGKAVLLPNIRALGDLESSDPPPSAEAALADLPPVMSAAQRIGALTKLVMAYYQALGTQMPAVSCLAAARELARLLDQAALSGDVDWAALEALVPEASLASHWQQSVRFLKIITDEWPAHLEEAQQMDPYVRRHAAAEAMAHVWQDTPPDAPVIIAGSTGATPASRVLMRAALNLPKGLVVLPGLDLELTSSTLTQLKSTPSHPQFTLARTLSELGLTPQAVQVWPNLKDEATQTARRRLIHESLAPAEGTSDWTKKLAMMSSDGDAAQFVKTALTGLDLIEASDDTEEALIAAIAMRETLETPGETAALVTPDAGLARRVSAMLRRWQIEVAPSAGLPLAQSSAGSFALLAANWLRDVSHPVALMALLQHPDARFDLNAVRILDKHVLRGPRVWQDWPSLLLHADCSFRVARDERGVLSDDACAAGTALLEALHETVESLTLPDDVDCQAVAWFETVAECVSAMAMPPRPWSGEDGAALSRLLRDMVELSEPLGVQSVHVWIELFEAEALAQMLPVGQPHPRLAIWGPLEARLQTADRLILAGLNEGIWPDQPTADAFLPRVFRTKIGLSDPDERIGLSAHDFAQLASAPRVTLLCSKRRDDKPAISARWIWRLKTLTRGALGGAAEAVLSPAPGHDPTAWLAHIEQAPPLPASFSAEPRPCPPLAARPSKLSVTRVEQLIRDPYAIYCESVLGLRALDPLNLPADVRVRGTAIHKALERFELERISETPEALLEVLEAELRAGGESEADLIALRLKRLEVCADYLIWRSEQSHSIIGDPYTEERGSLRLSIAGKGFELSGTADRIEMRVDGGIAVLDFKTGRPPSEKQVRAGLSPQMPLQGLIAREGGYEKLGPVEVGALTYIQFGTQFDVREIGSGAARGKIEPKSVSETIADAEAGLIELLTAFANPDHPYLSAPRPERVAYESVFSRLARRDEWTGLSTHD